ncbi:MAG: glutathione S-transferase family protein [Leptothrix sp. (in: b-proteobacteria)]
MSELVFHSNPQSRGRIVHWLLEELGQPYRTVWVPYGPPMKGPDYLALNPMGKVPTLQDGDAVVTEVGAICAYLADRFPQAGLAPAQGSAARAAYYRWLFFAAGPLEAATTARALDWQVPEGRHGMVGFGSLADTLRAVQTALLPGPYVCGEQFTVADVYLGSQLGWGMLFGTIDKNPVFKDYVGRLTSRPAWQRAQQVNEAQIAASAAAPH